MTLAAASAALDGVLSEVSLGIRNQRHYDELEEKLEGIAGQLRGAVRSCQR